MKISFTHFRIIGCFLTVSLLFVTGYGQIDTAKSRQLLVFPIITKSIETGWSFGTAAALVFRPSAKDTVSRTSNIELVGLYSTKKQLVAALNGSQYFHKERYILNEQFSFSSFPDKFWGLGKNTADDAVEPYKFKQTYVYLHLLRKLANKFFVGILYEKQNVWDVDYITGGLFDKQQVVGRQGYQAAGGGASLTFDSRNNAFDPDKGIFGQLYVNHFDKFWGSAYNYNNVMIDLKTYLELAYKQVLALELFSFNNTGNEVPLRSLASFGGAARMRGYYEGRYKDQNQLVMQAEYRFPIYKRFRGVVFGDAGNVGKSFKDYAFNELKYSYGAGLRFALSKKEKLNLRLDYGIGQGKNSGFYVQLGEAF